MIRIYVRKPSKKIGRVYKSHTSIKDDRVKILGWLTFLVPGLITEEEWAKSEQLISERFGLYIKESYINGRSKVGRNTPYFNWEEVIKSNHQVKL
jgi:hypothetical protein